MRNEENACIVWWEQLADVSGRLSSLRLEKAANIISILKIIFLNEILRLSKLKWKLMHASMIVS